MKKGRDALDEVLDEQGVLQLCKAIVYSGLWDINGDNILIDPVSKKIVYMDFEHNRNVKQNELFNGSIKKVTLNKCQAMVGFIRLFRGFPKQRKSVLHFVKSNNIDVESYIDERIAQMIKKKREYTEYSPLGTLLFCKDADVRVREQLKKTVYETLKNA